MTDALSQRRRQRQTNVLLLITVVLMVAAAIYQFLVVNPDSARIQDQLRDSQNAIHAGLVQNCEENGNPLRVAVQQILQDQIDQSHAVNLEKFFPQIPASQLHRLIHQQNQRRRSEIRQIAPVDCEHAFR